MSGHDHDPSSDRLHACGKPERGEFLASITGIADSEETDLSSRVDEILYGPDSERLDTSYFIARMVARDQRSRDAIKAERPGMRMITSSLVVNETVSLLQGRGMLSAALEFLQKIRSVPEVQLVYMDAALQAECWTACPAPQPARPPHAKLGIEDTVPGFYSITGSSTCDGCFASW